MITHLAALLAIGRLVSDSRNIWHGEDIGIS